MNKILKINRYYFKNAKQKMLKKKGKYMLLGEMFANLNNF